jgi:hypothetical protein
MARTYVRKTATNPVASDHDRDHRIRERAYHLWEMDGKPHGRDIEYWERARELIGIEESTASGLVTQAASASASRGQPRVEGATVQEDIGDPSDRLIHQGEVKTIPPPKRRSRAKPKNPG